MDDVEKERILAIIDLRGVTDAEKVRRIRRLLRPEPPIWTDTGTGPGYTEGGPYDPRD